MPFTSATSSYRLVTLLLSVVLFTTACKTAFSPSSRQRVAGEPAPKYEPIRQATTRPYVVFGKRYYPNKKLKPYREVGIASWYGPNFHGKKTAIGEIYDMHAFTAAHKILALPSYVRVTNQQNNRSIVVRLNDRGPFHGKRIIDLSYAAAKAIGIDQAGTGDVLVESLLPSGQQSQQNNAALLALESKKAQALLASVNQAAPQSNGIFLQFGAFSAYENALSFKTQFSHLETKNERFNIYDDGGLYRVQLGPFTSADSARLRADHINNMLGHTPFMVVR